MFQIESPVTSVPRRLVQQRDVARGVTGRVQHPQPAGDVEHLRRRRAPRRPASAGLPRPRRSSRPPSVERSRTGPLPSRTYAASRSCTATVRAGAAAHGRQAADVVAVGVGHDDPGDVRRARRPCAPARRAAGFGARLVPASTSVTCPSSSTKAKELTRSRGAVAMRQTPGASCTAGLLATARNLADRGVGSARRRLTGRGVTCRVSRLRAMQYYESVVDLVGNTPLVKLVVGRRRRAGHRAGQGGVLQPGRLGEGPDRAADGRGGREVRRARSRAARSSSPPPATPASAWRSSPSGAATTASSCCPTRCRRTRSTC